MLYGARFGVVLLRSRSTILSHYVRRIGVVFAGTKFGCCVPSCRNLCGVFVNSILKHRGYLSSSFVFLSSLRSSLYVTVGCAAFEDSGRNVLFGSHLFRTPIEGSV